MAIMPFPGGGQTGTSHARHSVAREGTCATRAGLGAVVVDVRGRRPTEERKRQPAATWKPAGWPRFSLLILKQLFEFVGSLLLEVGTPPFIW
jgi:hypothetical protein